MSMSRNSLKARCQSGIANTSGTQVGARSLGQSWNVVAFTLLVALTASVQAVELRGQDRVIVRDEETGQEVPRPGKILDYQGRYLELETVSGREAKIATKNVIRIETTYGESHQQALMLLGQHKYQEAFDALRNALADEERGWVQREIVAKRIALARLLGDSVSACQDFSRLTRSEAEHRFWAIIPIPWSAENPDGRMNQVATDWLENGAPVEKLMAASWLLNTNQKTVAERTLRELSRNQRNEIGRTAGVQLWRLEFKPSDEQLSTWIASIDEMPTSLRAGPRFLTAVALQKRDRHEEAATTYLKVRILHADVLPLAPQCLFEAGRSLVELDLNGEAGRVFNELRSEFPESIWTSQIPNLN